MLQRCVACRRSNRSRVFEDSQPITKSEYGDGSTCALQDAVCTPNLQISANIMPPRGAILFIAALESHPIHDELKAFGQQVGPTIGDRIAFVRAASNGQAISSTSEDPVAYAELCSLCDLVEKTFATEKAAHTK